MNPIEDLKEIAKSGNKVIVEFLPTGSCICKIRHISFSETEDFCWAAGPDFYDVVSIVMTNYYRELNK